MPRESLHTDREILQCIFEMYRASYPGLVVAPGVTENDPYMKIDVSEVARRLDCDDRLLFGRLYYSIDRKYGYIQSDGSRVHLFAAKVGDVYHSVNFSMLCATLADMHHQDNRFRRTVGVAIFAAVLSLIALFAK